MGSMTSGLSGAFTTFLEPVHKKFIEASKTPVVGIIPSALHAAISTVELVAGTFFALTAGVFYLATNNEFLGKIAGQGIIHTIVGGCRAINATLNFFSMTYYYNCARPNSL